MKVKQKKKYKEISNKKYMPCICTKLKLRTSIVDFTAGWNIVEHVKHALTIQLEARGASFASRAWIFNVSAVIIFTK